MGPAHFLSFLCVGAAMKDAKLGLSFITSWAELLTWKGMKNWAKLMKRKRNFHMPRNLLQMGHAMTSF